MTPYGDSGVANKTQNFEVTAQYQFDFGLRPAVSFLMSKGKDLNATDGDKDLVKYADIGATTTSTKTCPPMLITKSTCWTKTTASTLVTTSLLMT
jgi:hypothetical protein